MGNQGERDKATIEDCLYVSVHGRVRPSKAEIMERTTNNLVVDVAIGLVAGLVATKVTEYAQEALYGVTPDTIKEREERVRPGLPPQIAAQKSAAALGLQLDEGQLQSAGMAIHYGLGMLWGPVYGLLRRHSRMDPLGAGFVTGATFSLIVDEALTPALGFSAPSRNYPTLTHLRGFVGHLIFGATAALTAEAIYRLTETTPNGNAS